MTRAHVAASIVAALLAGPAAAGCIYDPALGQFRAYDPGADEALNRETLAGRDTDASRKIWEERVVMVDGRRFEATGLMSDTPEGLNGVLVDDKAMIAGVRFFGVSDPYADRIATLVGAIDCAFQLYDYRPILHGAWIEQQPFVFRYPALAVDRASFRVVDGTAQAIGFLMRGHPHADDEDPSLYIRVVLHADCDAKTAVLVDERSYGADGKALTRYKPSGAPVAFDELGQPALKPLAQLACEPPDEWPDGTRLKDGLDKFSEMVHAAAHQGG